MNFIEHLERIFLLFGQQYIYFTVVIIGFVALNRQLFAKSLLILFFTIILNILLKNFFKIPLNPALNLEGFAFPSGHMMGASVFYGFLIMNIRHVWLKILLTIMLTGLGSALIYFGYHNLTDIVGAVFFAIIIIFLFQILLKQQIFQKYPFLTGIFLLILTFFIMLYLNYVIKIALLPWMPFYGLFGFSSSWMLFSAYLCLPQSKLNIVLNLFIVIACVIIIFYVSNLLKNYLSGKSQIEWFFILFVLPMSVRVCHFKIISKWKYLN